MTDKLSKIRAALEFYANEWINNPIKPGKFPSPYLNGDDGRRAKEALSLLNAIEEPETTAREGELFICRRTVGGNSNSEYGTRYYIYEELEPYVRAPHLSPAWQDISTADKNGGEILGWFPNINERRIVWWCNEKQLCKAGLNGFWDSSKGSGVQPTAWQPLPAAPSEIRSEEKEVK